tara:strand:+ start:3676 stop:4638 length:963 start_codon:yes stop_codon:yes gene_type:complete
MHNIIITSAGRRVQLLNFFKDEAHQQTKPLSVYASDIKPSTSAACQVADLSFQSPHANSDDFISFLIDNSVKNKIGLIIPTIDTELLTLSMHREDFKKSKIEVVISDTDLVKICRNKIKTSKYFNSIGVATPQIYNKQSLSFPCFVKPLDGSSSIGAKLIANKKDLSDELIEDPNMVFMEYIDEEYQEYTVDAYYDKNGALKCYVPRKRLEIRAGEVSKGVTEKGKFFKYLKEVLNKIEGARGCITLQFFVNLDTNDYKAIEINPRFGGGYPLSYHAGANYPKWIIEEYLLNRNTPYFEEWQDSLLMLRYDSEIIITSND